MDEFKFYLDIPDSDIAVEYKIGESYYTRVWFHDEASIDSLIKKLEDLKIYAKYHDR